jgi:hypothetical protein
LTAQSVNDIKRSIESIVKSAYWYLCFL